MKITLAQKRCSKMSGSELSALVAAARASGDTINQYVARNIILPNYPSVQGMRPAFYANPDRAILDRIANLTWIPEDACDTSKRIHATIAAPAAKAPKRDLPRDVAWGIGSEADYDAAVRFVNGC